MDIKRVKFEWEGKQITLREAEVLLCCAHGFTSKETADKLFVSFKTIERHRENLRERFRLSGSHKLMNWAVKMQPQLVNG